MPKASAKITQDWSQHDVMWRDPRQVSSIWERADELDASLLEAEVRGPFWDILDETKQTLLISREYEHFLLGLSVHKGKPLTTYFPCPHPSGIAIEQKSGAVHVACTRNPNQVLRFEAVSSFLKRSELKGELPKSSLLMPVRSDFYPGCLYMHDLVCIGDKLFGNAVAHNAVVALKGAGKFERVWWPKCIEKKGKQARFDLNFLQLNSIAAGKTIQSSYFCASTDVMGRIRPGHKDFQVDGRGVVFSGRTRSVIARGLTRPHSLRLWKGKLWVNNSGYGELGLIAHGKMEKVARLPGWTRGLCFHQNYAFVGTSRVIPKFYRYAPGLDVHKSVCGLHIVDVTKGEVLASIRWREGNQIFAIEKMPRARTGGFSFVAGSALKERDAKMFYSFSK